jgi:diguanylate cyclase (GGDEF)-like protein
VGAPAVKQAHYDSLTGLPNRLAFVDGLRQSISRARRQRNTLGILFVDLDNFKLVNDSLGHPVGDEYIQIIVERFKECPREGDSVARLGGDEIQRYYFQQTVDGQGLFKVDHRGVRA